MVYVSTVAPWQRGFAGSASAHAEYPLFEQRLSIKLVRGGAEDY
jgi:hypothetical protein